MVHVCLYEFKGLFLDHSDCLCIKHATELLNKITADAFTLLAGLIEGVSDDPLHVVKGLDSLTHTQTEVTEPLMVKSYSPVFAQKLDGVGNDSIFVALSKLIEIVLVETDKAPETLQDNLFVTHVGDGVDQTYAVEGEFDEVTLACASVQVVTDKVASVLGLLFTRLQD